MGFWHSVPSSKEVRLNDHAGRISVSGRQNSLVLIVVVELDVFDFCRRLWRSWGFRMKQGLRFILTHYPSLSRSRSPPLSLSPSLPPSLPPSLSRSRPVSHDSKRTRMTDAWNHTLLCLRSDTPENDRKTQP